MIGQKKKTSFAKRESPENNHKGCVCAAITQRQRQLSVCRYVSYYIIIFNCTANSSSSPAPVTLPYFESCLSHCPSGGFNLAQEESPENSVKMRNGGRIDRKPSNKLATCLDLVINLTGSPLGLEPTNFTLTSKTGNHKG